MFTKKHAEQIRDILTDLHGRWSANDVVKAMSALNAGLTRVDALDKVREWLGTGTRKAGRPPENQPLLIGSEPIIEIGTEPIKKLVRNQLTAPDLKGYLYITSWLRHSGFSLTSFAAKQNSASEDEKITDWALELASQFATFAGKELRDLDRKERHCLGRVHALLFCNNRVNESANIAKGLTLAAVFARMAQTKRFADLTALDYVKFGVKVWKAREGKAFHSPFDIDAVVEYERA